MKNGFSLVELSIVLVILGLLVGGILAGKSLIHASELRKVTSDITRYRTAAYAFRDRYFQLPGDMNNAANFWPTAVNGNNDGRISYNKDGINFWHHLQQARLLEGYIAPVSSTVATLVINTHAPPGPVAKSGYSIVYFGSWTEQPHLVGRNILGIGAASGSWTGSPIFSPEDMWNIDTKMDDGIPDLGLIIAYGGTSGSYPTSTYRLNDPSSLGVVLVDFFK